MNYARVKYELRERVAIIAMNDGLVPPILSALGVSAPALRAAILDRCRQAS